jgi:hypothetical protein
MNTENLYKVQPSATLTLGYTPPVIRNGDGSLYFSHHPDQTIRVVTDNKHISTLTREEAAALASWLIHCLQGCN